jgi:hypothetical protein
MALWGNKDTKSVTGTLSFTSGSAAVTGTDTLFTTELAPGQRIVTAAGEYQIASIESATALTLTTNAVTMADQTVTANEKPSYLDSTDASVTFGVNVAEVTAGSDSVTSVALSFAGTGYTEATHTVTVTGGGGSDAALTYSGSAAAPGTITSVSVTNVGSGYTSVPTVTFGLPRRTINTTFINTTTNLISYPGHLLNAGDVVKYFDGGGTEATGLTDNTTYYVIASGLTANTFKVSDTDAGTEVDISGTGNVDQYFEVQGESRRATAVAALGAGAGGTHITHPGWVKQTIGTGGRAGRVTFETLVAMKTISGDAADDLVLPDA